MQPSPSAFRRNIYSQSGEDGVLEEMLRRLEIRSGTFVEFGAGDGRSLSNTCHLLEQGWSGVYIEADKSRFRKLVENTKRFARNVELLNVFVQPGGPNSLDNLLASTRIQPDFDLLSIDVDSFDWQIWQSLRNYHPAIVIIEINSSIPVGIYQTHRDERIQGSSFSSTVDLGTKKGYTLVCHTGNGIFVKNALVPKLDLPESDLLFPETLFDYRWKYLTYELPLSPAVMVRLSRLFGTLSKIKRKFSKNEWSSKYMH